MSTTLVIAHEITPDRVTSLIRQAKRSKLRAEQDQHHARSYDRDAKRLRAAMLTLSNAGVWFDEQEATRAAEEADTNAKIFRQSEQRNRADMIGALLATLDMV